MDYIKWVICNYNGDIDWLNEYTDDYIIYDRSDKIVPEDSIKVVRTDNVGSNIYCYMSYIVDNYDNLPDRVLFGKSNMLERHITKEEFDECLEKEGLVPLLTSNHEPREGICWYEDGLYCEINNSWYVNHYPHKHYEDYNEFARQFGLPIQTYLAFSPGACWVVPRQNILKHSKEYYQRLKDIVSYDANPAEAHMIERALCYIWS